GGVTLLHCGSRYPQVPRPISGCLPAGKAWCRARRHCEIRYIMGWWRYLPAPWRAISRARRLPGRPTACPIPGVRLGQATSRCEIETPCTAITAVDTAPLRNGARMVWQDPQSSPALPMGYPTVPFQEGGSSRFGGYRYLV